MTDVTAASSTARWWLQDEHREQFDAASREGGQMSPRSWTNRPDEGERFGKFLAGLNPLQHIPGVNLVYRELTGETLEPGQQVLGGALFGGVFGLISGLFNAVVSSSTGKDIAGTVMGIFDRGDKIPAPAVASNAAVPMAAVPPTPATPAAPMTPAAFGGREAVIAPGADGKLPDVLDLDALAPAAGPSTAPAKPVAAAPAPAPQPVNIAAATDDRRWFPARGREYPRGLNTVAPPTSPAVAAAQNSRSEMRLPYGGAVPMGQGAPQGLPQGIPAQGIPAQGIPAQALPPGMQMPMGVPVSNKAGAGAYGSALELSRELQKHYLGTAQ